ncbi:transporter [candidate division TA06 bacterium DG_26]|uniref:Transporter n=1 Tax=candidate division TA06 bacterium DG_26 TaxID=1703771 RepID=A0A0S7WL99_UNCT6|nr:MAG: transporter [candidate division TA06 bacterium DG_26]
MAEARERWSSRTSFVMAAIGAAIGLGNVWRFPYVCYANGGGAFLIPYFVALLTAGIPLMILEYSIGHRMQGGAPFTFRKLNRNFEWIGWFALLVVFVLATYYTVILAWCFNYLVHSVKLAWGADAKHFFESSLLQLSGSVGELGTVRLPILLGLVATWVWIYLSLFKGVKILGKIVIFTVTIPWAIIVIMVIRGLSLPGALTGLRFYLTPDFGALLRPGVWLAAYGQIFFSLSLAMGTLIVYASYLPKKSDIANNAYITSLADAGTSFFAGFAVFSTLGYLAQSMGVAVPEVTGSGFGLAFMTYPTAIRLLPIWAPFFGVLFFILLLTLGIDSAFSQVEPVIAGFTDKWNFSKKKVLPTVCIIAFVVGIVYTTKGGYYWLDIMDYFVVTVGLTLVGFLECIAVGWIFGAKRVRGWVNEVSEFTIGRWWDIVIKVVTPGILGISLFWEIAKLLTKGYGGYPLWASTIGVCVFGGIIVVSLLLGKLRGKEE